MILYVNIVLMGSAAWRLCLTPVVKERTQYAVKKMDINSVDPLCDLKVYLIKHIFSINREDFTASSENLVSCDIDKDEQRTIKSLHRRQYPLY